MYIQNQPCIIWWLDVKLLIIMSNTEKRLSTYNEGTYNKDRMPKTSLLIYLITHSFWICKLEAVFVKYYNVYYNPIIYLFT